MTKLSRTLLKSSTFERAQTKAPRVQSRELTRSERPTTSRARSSNFLKWTQPWKARPFAPQFESPASPLATLRVTDQYRAYARIQRMRPSLTFSISLIIAANLHSAIAQSSPTPAPTPVTLRSLLLSELHSTHDNAEWFTPIQAAVAGLTAEQAKWVPPNAQGKTDPSANAQSHSKVFMIGPNR